MVLSPMSGLASFSVYCGKYSPCTFPAGAVNQRSGMDAKPDAKVGAVARHHGDDGAALHALRRFEHGFPGGHAQVQEEVIVAVDELDHLRQDFVVLVRARQRRTNRAQEQRGGGAVAVVALVAHVQRLGDQAFDVDPIGQGLQGAVQRRVEIGLHPFQAGVHFRSHPAVAQDFSQALRSACSRRGCRRSCSRG